MQNIVMKSSSTATTEQMRDRLKSLADELDAMGEHVAAAHVSSAIDHLSEAGLRSKPTVD
ncbi:hypothetical protein [Altericroceibacterium xinjiangense]|uniref:hypothetical protein n=1 Tax=Altericroceibacterium xinjiangense TaxID=762261 RepID=UPI0013DF214A|nr:hypothetical protein [Altericroceibacterium xinjiangense]